MSGQKAPPAPNYAPIAEAMSEQTALSRELALAQNEISREALDWAKKTYTENKQITDDVVERFLDTQEKNQATAEKDRARYESTFQPLEDDLAREAEEYSSPAKRELEMGRAIASTEQQFEGARQAALRDLESYGVNPSASRFAALDIGVRTQAAAAKAAAGNQAGQMVDATGRALRSEAINVGKGYPGQIAGQYGTSLQGGQGAGGQTLAQTASGANTMGTGTQWAGTANASAGTGVNAANSWANTLNMGHQNSMAQYKADQESSGWGSALGLVGGLASGFMGIPTNGSTIGRKMMGYNEGGAVEGDMDGGAVPEQVSPSRGKAIDDVPAQVSVGEFIVPKDVVSWFGEKHMYGLIEKADKERTEKKEVTGAVPTMRAAPNPPSAGARRQALEIA